MRTFLVLLVATFSASCLNRVEGIEIKMPEGMAGKFNDADTAVITSALKNFNEKAGIKPPTHWDFGAIKRDFDGHLAKFQKQEPPAQSEVDLFKTFLQQLLHGHNYKPSWTKLQGRLTPADVKRFETHIGNIKTFGTNANKNAEDIAKKIDEVITQFANTKRNGRKITTKEVNTYLKRFYKNIDKDPWFNTKEGKEHLKVVTRATKKLVPIGTRYQGELFVLGVIGFLIFFTWLSAINLR